MFLQSTLPLAANVGSRQFFSGGLHALVQALRRKAQGNGSERTFSVKLEPGPECNLASRSHLHPEQAKVRQSSIAKPRH